MPVFGVLDLDRVSFVGDRELARTTAVNSSVGTTTKLKLEGESGASRNGLAAGAGKRSTVAREVAAAGIEGVLDGVSGQRLRLRNVHVGVGHAQEGSGHDGHAADGRHSVEVEHRREGGGGNDWMRVVERVSADKKLGPASYVRTAAR